MSHISLIFRLLPTRLTSGLGLGVLLVVLAPALHAQDPIVAGSMPEDYMPGLKAILTAATKQSPTMISNAIQIAQSEASLVSSDSALYPHISAGGTYGVSRQSVESDSENGIAGSSAPSTAKSFSYNIGAQQNIFTWGAIWNQTRISKLQLLIQKRSYAEAYRTLVVNLRDTYFALMMRKLAIRNAEANLKLVQGTYDLAQQQYKSGMIPSSGLTGPKLAYEDNQLAYDKAVEDYGHAKHMLAQVAGLKDIDENDIANAIPAVTFSSNTADTLLAEFLRDGAKSTYQAESLEMTIRQQQLNYKIARVTQLPKFYANAGYSLSNTTSVNVGTLGANGVATPSTISQEAVSSLNYGISASWDIFDGFAANAAIRSARQSKRYYERQLQTYFETTLEQAQDDRRQLEFSMRAMRLSETRRGLAQAGVDQSASDQKYGTGTQAAVDNANYQLYLADYYLAQARADFLSRWSGFVSLVGADPALASLPVQYVRATH